jgi:hypothetical protein
VTYRLDRRPLAVHALLQLFFRKRTGTRQRRIDGTDDGGFGARLVDAGYRDDRRRRRGRVGN